MERDLLEELEQCIDIEKFCGLGKECYVEMASKFNDLSVFKKMGYEEEGKITFWGGLQEWQKELSAFVGRKKRQQKKDEVKKSFGTYGVSIFFHGGV